MESVEVTPAARAAIDEVAGHDGAFLLPRTRPAHALDPYLRERLLRDAMVIALGREGRTFGLLVIANRTGDVSTFTSNDRTLFETFAGHAGVLLENDRVKEQLQYQAYHDALTGLPNRALFSERVAAAVARTDGATSVLFVDLDDFKMINDTHGHVVGDELLIAAAERIRACLRPGDVAARLGGDEFAVLLADPDDDDAAIVAGRIVDAMHASFVLHGRETRVHASIGIAAASGASTVDELLTHADVAMYAAKAAGKQQYATYEPRMHTRVRRRHEVGAALERALENDEIRVYFQPIVALADARTVAVEALVRWQHPTRGLLPPGAFLAVAEERGHIGEIGRRVLAEACACVAEWRESFEHLAVAVNLSPSELLRPRVSEDVAAALAAASLPGDALTIEITESGAMADPAAALAAMVELRSLGVRLALDDFGTGYSSLSHLRDFPIDMLKIAKPFIADLGSATPDTRFLEAILQLASALDLDVVTEGIETPAQAHLLHRLESALGQGYYFSRPLPPDEVPRQLAISAARRRGRGATVVALPAAR